MCCRSINKVIKERRLKLGLSEETVANIAGLSIYEYGDVEAYPKEFYDQISLGQASMVCDALALDIIALLPECGAREDLNRQVNRRELVIEARKRTGLSRDDLAQQIGYETVAVARLEEENGYMDTMCISAILAIAGALEVDPCLLIRA